MEEEKQERSELAVAAAGDCSASDLDFSFTSTASTSSSFATTFAASSSSSVSARSSLSLSLPSFSASTTIVDPLPHSLSNCGPHWSAIRTAASLSRDNNLHLRHLHLLRHLGSGHLARVFHCRLKGSESFDFALKVVDLDAGGKLSHVRTEAQVLAALDHPFLPTLYARMDASHYSCFLIDYCPGGDLHSLLLRHPGHRLPASVVKFFAAEVLLALEYLHSLGFVYRDLKPENVLIRADGHVMLSDFDLCFSSDVSPWVDDELQEVVAEPVGAYSRACVGTHEYLAPEIVSVAGHGNGVDWWAFGVFVYELLYGRTPFKGETKEATLKNIMSKDLEFPESSSSNDKDEKAARDLIRRLLAREPEERMGSRRGAAEIKKHPFFDGVRWQMMRCERPPPVAVGTTVGSKKKKKRGGWWWCRMSKLFGSSSNNKSKSRLTGQKAMK